MVCQSIMQSNDMRVVSVINTINDNVDVVTVPIKERLGVEELLVVIKNFESDGIKEYDEMVCLLHRNGSYIYAHKNIDLDSKNKMTPPARPSIEDPPIFELKALSSYLYYLFLEADNTFSVIIVADLIKTEVGDLLSMLQRLKRYIRWTIVDIVGMSLGICTHKIQL